MKKEKIKTAILLVSIFSTVILALNVWFGSGIWPHGYNFFVSLKDRAFFSRLFQKEQPYESPMESLAKPQKLVVTNGGNRAVYYNSDVSYAPYFEETKAFFNAVLQDETAVSIVTEVDKEEWYDVLRNDELLDTRSLYIEYKTAFSTGLFAKITGITSTWLANKAESVREFILAPVGEGTEEVLLYVRDYSTGKIIKCYVHYKNADSLYQKIANMGENANYSYAFELNLHDSGAGIGGEAEQKVVFSPLILISPRSAEGIAITAQNPIRKDMDMDVLLSVFNYKERALNRYTEPDGTIHFVENYGSVTIYPNGVLEYYALDAEKGIAILPEKEGAATLYDSLNGAVRFAERVWKSLMPDQPFDALVSGDLVEKGGGSYTFTMDYYYKGTSVITDIQSDYHRPMQHAVEVEVQNGRIIKYRHFMRRFKSEGTPFPTKTMLEAVDGIYLALAESQDKLQITDLFLGYVEDTAGGMKAPVWCARIEGREELVYYTP